MKATYDRVAAACCKITTQAYTNSFALGIRLLHRKFHNAIYAIYGFFRLGDEIVDSFHDYPKAALLQEFQEATHRAIRDKISLNPILNAFQYTVHTYAIDTALIDTFFDSMRMDLTHKSHTLASFQQYLLGSSEVVGLMCLQVFCEKDQQQYEQLKPYAMRLGKALQKVNFLRDLRVDYHMLGRTYFPHINFESLTEASKQQLQEDIAADFAAALVGIKQLPASVRLGVYLAYRYYKSLFNKICRTPISQLLQQRIRIPNYQKYAMLVGAGLRYRFNKL